MGIGLCGGARRSLTAIFESRLQICVLAIIPYAAPAHGGGGVGERGLYANYFAGGKSPGRWGHFATLGNPKAPNCLTHTRTPQPDSNCHSKQHQCTISERICCSDHLLNNCENQCQPSSVHWHLHYTANTPKISTPSLKTKFSTTESPPSDHHPPLRQHPLRSVGRASGRQICHPTTCVCVCVCVCAGARASLCVRACGCLSPVFSLPPPLLRQGSCPPPPPPALHSSPP